MDPVLAVPDQANSNTSVTAVVVDIIRLPAATEYLKPACGRRFHTGFAPASYLQHSFWFLPTSQPASHS